MCRFSKLYKKMSATADEKIQWGRFQIRGDDRIECYGRDSYADQVMFTLLSIKDLNDDEKAKQVEEYVWIPASVDLRDLFIPDRKIQRSEEAEQNAATAFKTWREEHQELLDKVKKGLPDDVENAFTLMYVMEKNFRKAWDWDEQSWKKRIPR